MRLLVCLAAGLLLSAGTAESARRCAAGDYVCMQQQARQAARPGNSHYQAEQRRLNGAPPATCSTRPKLDNSGAVPNNPACR